MKCWYDLCIRSSLWGAAVFLFHFFFFLVKDLDLCFCQIYTFLNTLNTNVQCLKNCHLSVQNKIFYGKCNSKIKPPNLMNIYIKLQYNLCYYLSIFGLNQLTCYIIYGNFGYSDLSISCMDKMLRRKYYI